MNKVYFYSIGFGILILFDTLTQVSFKLSSTHAGGFVLEWSWLIEVFKNPWIYGAVVGYLGAFVAWMTLLKHAPVGPAFAASHLEIVFVLIISSIYFGEKLNVMQIFGALCIVAGIVFLSLSESKSDHD
ncbi:multidrug efflux SMR transporter [Methylotenera sp.]|uniref:DMT family transporter n=1 Tax=Methylotenera sp. TaxID=2051956 RepID=UPI002488E819|nr:DMT family transporter [Methylotenera sp.]MDI1298318.1 DMT family transporter [Methylotenera sp.]